MASIGIKPAAKDLGVTAKMIRSWMKQEEYITSMDENRKRLKKKTSDGVEVDHEIEGVYLEVEATGNRGLSLQVMLDSGSSWSFVVESVAKKLGLQINRRKKIDILGSHIFKTLGMANVQLGFKVEGDIGLWAVHVVPDESQRDDFILGIDFCRQYVRNIYFDKSRMIELGLPGRLVKVKYNCKPEY